MVELESTVTVGTVDDKLQIAVTFPWAPDEVFAITFAEGEENFSQALDMLIERITGGLRGKAFRSYATHNLAKAPEASHPNPEDPELAPQE